MLTFDETLAAIRALNTDPDIINRACAEIVNPGETAKLSAIKDDPYAVASLLLSTYKDKIPSDDFMIGSIAAGGRLAGLMVKPEEIVTMRGHLVNLISGEFMEGIKSRIRHLQETNPLAAKDLTGALTKALLGALEERLKGMMK